jgi:hypothetical protein
MTAFRIFLAAMLIAVVVYTVLVIADYGLSPLFPVFFADIGKMAWPGRFNLDFLCMLMMSGFWVAWRHHFSPGGLVLGVLGLTGGAPFLTAYLFITSIQTNGDVAEILLGKTRAEAR